MNHDYGKLFEEEHHKAMEIANANDWIGCITPQAWLETMRTSKHGNELMLRFSEPLPSGHDDFWLPLHVFDGTLVGWMRFSYVTSIHFETVFAGTEWRPASEPSPFEPTA